MAVKVLSWVAFILMAATIPAHADVIYYNGGGVLDTFAVDADRRTEQHDPPAIAGVCMSACTMYLSVPGACVGPHASLWFHAPTPDEPDNRTKMLARYPFSVRNWLDQQGGLRKDWLILDGAALRNLVPPCPHDERYGL